MILDNFSDLSHFVLFISQWARIVDPKVIRGAAMGLTRNMGMKSRFGVEDTADEEKDHLHQHA